MDSIVDSFAALSVCIEIGFAMLGTALAVACGALLAFKLSPFNPSGSLAPADARESFYLETQARLREARAKRAALVKGHVRDLDATTRPVDLRPVDLVTVPDLSLAESFSVVPVRTVPVGGVRPLPVLQVR